MTSEYADSRRQRRSRTVLLVVLALFVAPVAIAWLLFFVFPGWIPDSTTNNGDLVKPARPLPTFELATQGDEPVDETFLRGKWTFVYLHAGECESDCVDQLYKIRQLRLAQGKDIDRLQRLMLWQAEGVDAEARTAVQAHFPGQLIAFLAGSPPELVSAFQPMAGEDLEAGRIFLVDPLGNLMMSYPPDAEPRGIIKDLHRLLKYSGLG